jgi:hypothetical protein
MPEVDERKGNPLISEQYPVGDCATMPGRTGGQALLFTFVAFSGVVAFQVTMQRMQSGLPPCRMDNLAGSAAAAGSK